GVHVDVPAHRGVRRLGPGEPVTVADLQATGVAPQHGDIVVVRTGWAQHWHDRSAYLGDEQGVPGIDVEAARWLADRGVAAVGSDTLALEQIPPATGLTTLPVHRLLLAERGINLIEAMSLETLAERGITEFVFAGAPLNILGATGAPIRPLALIGP
ncbi:MAG: cyclase family protein, partial [Nocardioidaceae bacterium]